MLVNSREGDRRECVIDRIMGSYYRDYLQVIMGIIDTDMMATDSRVWIEIIKRVITVQAGW